MLGLAVSCHAEPIAPTATTQPVEQWKTAFYKRGFVGNYQAGWADGLNSTLRLRVPLALGGSKVRITLAPMREEETILSKLSLAPAKDGEGTIASTPVALSFAGKPELKIAPNQADVVSDAADISIKPGAWYLQESYASEKYLYAYSVDGFFNEAGDRHDAPKLAEFKNGAWPGNVTRIEVLTSDTRPIILCYGDSITHGYNSTPNGGKAYPEVLGRLTKLPTLNFGVNGDVITYSGGAPGLVESCQGVQSVIVLMGINDIISGMIKSPQEYSNIAANLIANLKHGGRKVYFGTLPPATGFAAFDKDPNMEILRQAINAWIRKESGADAVIDFDAALADPENPARMKTEYQSDWLHPNDAGYEKMAEVAAKEFLPAP